MGMSRGECLAKLQDWGIEQETISHALSPTCEEHSENIRGTPFEKYIGKGQAKNLFLKVPSGGGPLKNRLFLVCALVETVVEPKTLSSRLGIKASAPLRLAPDDVYDKTLQIPKGSVNPFVMAMASTAEITLILDHNFKTCDRLLFHPMQSDYSTALSAGQLDKFLDNCCAGRYLYADFSAKGAIDAPALGAAAPVAPAKGAASPSTSAAPAAKAGTKLEDPSKALDQLEAYLADNAYLGGGFCATLEDYRVCQAIPAGSVKAEKFPHLHRWHANVAYLMKCYPQWSPLHGEIPAGKPPVLSAAAPAEVSAPKESSPKREAAPKAATKKEAAPKKEAAAKKVAAPKKDDKKADAKAEDPPAVDRKKLLKAVIKEGGKRGVEIEGAADMGGLQFFCTSVDEPQGDLEFVVECVKAMNNQPIPGDEERKGCSGHIGKMIFSAGTEQLAVAAYVPEAKQGELECVEWLETVLGLFGGEVAMRDKTLSTGFVKADGNKNVFPLKIREPMILEANNFLRRKGLFPEDKDSDDDDMVFGDDDFPS